MARRFLICFIASFAIAISAAAQTAPPKIGVLMPFTGEIAPIAEKARKGFALAEEEYAGRVKIVYEDIGGLGAAKAVTAAVKLLEIDRVSVIVGPFGPEQTIPVAAVAAKKGISLISFTLCSRAFVRMKNLFCGYPSIPKQLEAMRGVLAAKKLDSLAVVTEESEFGNESGAGVAALAEKLRVAVPLKTAVPASDRDLRSVVAQVVRARPKAVFVAFGDPAMAFAFLKQLWDGGFRGTRFAFIDYDDKYLRQFGKFTDGLLVPGAFTGGYRPEYLERYRAHYQEEPDVYSAQAYDLLRTALRAFEANGWSGKALEAKVPGLDYSDTAIAGFRFTADRSVDFPMGVLVAQQGRFVSYPH